MLGRLWALLTRSERVSLFRILPWVIGSAVLEVVGIASIMPFLALLADPEALSTVPIIGRHLVGIDIAPLDLLRWVAAGVAVAVLGVNGFIALATWRLLGLAWHMNHTISTRLLRHYLGQPYSFLLGRNTADPVNKITQEVLRIAQDAIGGALDLIAKSVAALAIVVFLVALNPLLALLAFSSLVGGYGLVYLATRHFATRIGREATQLNRTRIGIVNEAMGGFKDLKVTGREAEVAAQFVAPSRRYAYVRAAGDAIGALPRFALEAVAVAGMILIASLLASRSASFSEILPLLGAYAFAGLRLMPSLQSIFQAVTKIRYSTGAIEAVEADFELPVERDLDRKDAITPSLQFGKGIELKGVWYSYPTSTHPVLSDINLVLPRQSSIALIGRTGSGKTTLADLILGLLMPSQGTVEVDGLLVSRANLPAYRRLFGYVAQNIYMSDANIWQNVAFGLPDEAIDKEAVRRACRAAQISEFIENELPDSFSTLVGERGIRLSGGQRQRIGIARALYHDPPILIFDEATSALDVHTEQALYDALASIAETRTVITIAHRLETIEKADHVVVLEKGRIIDQGPADEVLRRFRLQIGTFVGDQAATGTASPDPIQNE